MSYNKLILILVLILILNCSISKEGFTTKEIEMKSNEIYANKNIFKPNVKYTTVKNKMAWIDPIVYNNIYKLSLKQKLSINNIKNTLNNSIK
jgi:hypothetical protein